MGLLELMGSGTLAICHAERLDAHQQHVLADYPQTGWFHRDRGQDGGARRARVVLVADGEQEVLAGLAPPLRGLVAGASRRCRRSPSASRTSSRSPSTSSSATR